MADKRFFFQFVLVILMYLDTEVVPRFRQFQLCCQPEFEKITCQLFMPSTCRSAVSENHRQTTAKVRLGSLCLAITRCRQA